MKKKRISPSSGCLMKKVHKVYMPLRVPEDDVSLISGVM